MAPPQWRQDVAIGVVHRQNEDLRVRRFGKRLAGTSEPLMSGVRRSRSRTSGRSSSANSSARASTPHSRRHGEIRVLFDHALDSLANHRMIVGHDDRDHSFPFRLRRAGLRLLATPSPRLLAGRLAVSRDAGLQPTPQSPAGASSGIRARTRVPRPGRLSMSRCRPGPPPCRACQGDPEARNRFPRRTPQAPSRCHTRARPTRQPSSRRLHRSASQKPLDSASAFRIDSARRLRGLDAVVANPPKTAAPATDRKQKTTSIGGPGVTLAIASCDTKDGDLRSCSRAGLDPNRIERHRDPLALRSRRPAYSLRQSASRRGAPAGSRLIIRRVSSGILGRSDDHGQMPRQQRFLLRRSPARGIPRLRLRLPSRARARIEARP